MQVLVLLDMEKPNLRLTGSVALIVVGTAIASNGACAHTPVSLPHTIVVLAVLGDTHGAAGVRSPNGSFEGATTSSSLTQTVARDS